MPDTATLALFLGASLTLLVIPGPTVMYIVARGIHQGRSAALVSTLGVEVGTLIQLVVATLGMSALVMSSDLAFAGLKHLGAAYLIWLGVCTLFENDRHRSDDLQVQTRLLPIFLQGVLVEVLNPKTAIFFLAFLPQFADPARGPVAWQILALGSIFILLAICNDALIGVLAGTLGERLQDRAWILTAQRYAASGIYLSLAALASIPGVALY